MDTDLDKLQADIDAARASYFSERALLVKTAGWIYADGPSAADAIESLVDELGPAKAVEQLLVKPDVYGTLGATASDQVIADQAELLEPELTRLLEAQDRLEALTGQREDVLAVKEPSRLRIVNVGGREISVDSRLDEIRAVADASERYAVAETGQTKSAPNSPTLSPTEHFARATGAEKARPGPERTKARGR